MYFGTKNYLKNNRNHTTKHALNHQYGVFTVNECTVQLLAIFLGKLEVLKTLSNSFLLHGNSEYQQKLF